jgi:hypothetical protein
MPMIPEDIIERAWREVGALEPQAARRTMAKIGKRQPAPLAYVLAETRDDRPQVQELAVYLFVVVFRMFESVPGHRLEPVPIERVERQSAANDEALERLNPAHERFLERAAQRQSEAQPHVMRYLSEAILEIDDPNLDLTEEEQGQVFRVLKTVVDLLSDSCKPRSRP